jgi:hypothetical protein
MTRPSTLAQSASGASALHVHIKRLVVDAALLGPMTPVVLGEQLRATLTTGTAVPVRAPEPHPVTGIYGAVASRIAERLDGLGGSTARV